jgi:GNAT superfamily N-acetyltransferase
MVFKITTFHRKYQKSAKKLVLEGLKEHWGSIDPRKNPDLDDISKTYKGSDFFIAWQDDEIIGTGALVHASYQVAEIVRVSVAPKFRRLGFGHRIVNHLVETAKKKGYKKIILETTETWNEVINFYLAFGFKITHRVDGDCFFELLIEN